MRYALLSLALVGCAAAPVRHSATPVTLSSGSAETPATYDIGAACDTYRARFQRTPVRLADGTPVWCF